MRTVALRPFRVFLAFTLALLAGLSGCTHDFNGPPVPGASLSGAVHGGQQPIAGALIQLYAVGTTGDGSPANPRITTVTVTSSDGTGVNNANANAGNGFNTFPVGGFTISNDYTCPSANAQMYLTATGGNPGLGGNTSNKAIAMLAALGNCGNLGSSTSIQINELTTVGSIAPLFPYITSVSAVGSGNADALQLSQAFTEVNEYANIATGSAPGATLPAGYYASTTELVTLADIMAGCINSSGGTAGDSTTCGQLFTLATPPGGTAPTDTVSAITNILKFPTQNVAAIFSLVSPTAPFQPTLSGPPANWSLPIVPIAATPVISPASGSYMGPQTVTITDATAKSAIYYTVDGTAPTTSSTLYTGSFLASTSQTINAIAVASGYMKSAVATSKLAITSAGVAAKLAFITQPVNTAYGIAINPAVQVAVEDAFGNIVTTANSTITLSLSNNPGNATLGGTVSQNAVNGIATFNNLTISATGNGYQFAAFGGGFFALSNTFNITLYPITVSPADPLLGVGSTLPGTFTLSQPAPTGGLTVTLSSSATTNLTVSPATVQVAAGATTGSFTYKGIAVGPANIVASATGYLDSSSTVTVTNSYISLGTLPAVTIGATSTLSLSLGAVAPAGGLTVSFTSSNPNVATVSPSVFVPAGAQLPAQMPTITGTGPGTAIITASAPNFAPDIRSVTLTLGLSLPATLTVPLSTPTSATLTLSAPAPAGGIVVTLSTDKTSVATVPATVTVPAGASTASVLVTGVTQGTTTLRANYTGSAEATTAITVQGTIGSSNPVATGVGLVTNYSYFYTQSAPSTPVTFTVTSSNPAVATVAAGTTATTVGTASISFPNIISGNSTQYYNVQGQTAGTTTITITGSGYTTVSYVLTVYPSALVLSSSASTLSVAGTNNYSVYTAYLNPTTSAILGSGLAFNPGSGSISIPVTSSNTAVATVSGSPVTFTAGQSSATYSVKGVAPGTTTIALGAQPAGFTTPANGTQFTQTVSTPTISSNSPSLLGVGLSGSYSYGYLSSAPATTGTMTITSSNPAVAAVAAGTYATTIGGASVSCSLASQNTYCYYTLQGLTVGTSTITITFPGYTSYTSTVTVDPSALVFNSSSFTTTVNSSQSLSVTTAILNPTTLAVLGTGYAVNPGAGPLSIAITSGTPAVGTITNSPVSIPAGSTYANATFQALSAGSSTLTLGPQPAGLSTPPAANTSLTATVSAPVITTSGAQTTGVGLTGGSYSYVYLSSAPAAGVTITLTSSNPAVATLGTGSTATAVGTASISFTNVTGNYNYQYYNVQGQSVGTSTITVSAPGYTTTSFVVTVLPSALVINNYYGSATTTTFSAPTTVTVTTAALSNATTVYNTGYAVNPGVGPLSIAVVSGTPSVGTITSSPVSIAAGQSSATTTFKPASAGTSVVSLGAQPTGFSTPPTAYSQETFTVTAPAITTSGAVTVGVGLNNGAGTGSSYYYGASSAGLSVTPPTPSSMTVTSSNPAVATISPGQTATIAGTGTLTFTNITTTNAQYFNVQGISVGTSTITVTSAGYMTSTFTVTVDPSGFVFTSGSISTSTYSAATPVTISTAVLTPGTFQLVSTGQPLNPGTGTLTIGVTSGTPSVGTISSSPVSFTAGQATATTNFQPVTAGSTTLALGTQPAGFSAAALASNLYLNATVTAPSITTYTSSAVTAGSSQTYNYAELNVNPPTPVTVTITSSNPSVATVAVGSATTGGTASISFSNVSNTNYNYYSIIGVASGSTVLTISAPGYTTVTANVTVQ